MLPQGVFLTEIEAAEFFQKRGISLKAKTLAKLRSAGGGPPFVYVGRWPRYTDRFSPSSGESGANSISRIMVAADRSSATTWPSVSG
jgi:hypothetical protein